MAEASNELIDRRQRRRQQTIEEVLDVAAGVMAEEGAGGLSVGEVARRMGIQTPSLYGYFPSKHALYDALFRRGAAALLDAMRTAHPDLLAGGGKSNDNLEDTLVARAETFVRWCVEHPAYAQLLVWRPVPGFSPSPEAYEPSIALVEDAMREFRALQKLGLLRDDIPVDSAVRDWTILISGVVSQQLSNEPEQGFTTGSFTTALPGLVAMFCTYYRAKSSPPRRRG